jgi:hypothetical protein
MLQEEVGAGPQLATAIEAKSAIRTAKNREANLDEVEGDQPRG